jgi:hypothetical protein
MVAEMRTQMTKFELPFHCILIEKQIV